MFREAKIKGFVWYVHYKQLSIWIYNYSGSVSEPELKWLYMIINNALLSYESNNSVLSEQHSKQHFTQMGRPVTEAGITACESQAESLKYPFSYKKKQ